MVHGNVLEKIMTATNSELFIQTLAQAAARWALPLTDAQLDLMRRHYEAVVETNRAFNLTRITGPIESAIKHYVDSLALLRWAGDRVSRNMKCLDVGTGAGFPAIPLAIAVPNWLVTAIDSTRKKIDFVSRTADALQLDNLHAEHARSEHWACDDQFNIVAARAVSSTANCIIKTAQHVKRGGALVLYKSATMDQAELKEAASVASQHRLKLADTFTYTLTCENETMERALLVYARK